MTVDVGVNVVPLHPTALLEAGLLAEELGFESVWIGEHIIVPEAIESPYPHADRPPFGANTRFLEPIAALCSVAAVTSTIRLGTGVLVLPARDPFVTARSIVTADVLSGGRFELGVGVGWMRDEFRIMGMEFDNRVARMLEMIELFNELFTAEHPTFHGEFWKLPESGFEPKPIQKPRPPLLMGGISRAALRRTADHADGWIGPNLTAPEAREFVDELVRLRGNRAPLRITVQAAIDADLDEYSAAGVDRVIVVPWQRSREWREGMTAAAASFGLPG
jgi:probable F420-dependent oxidoreductase